MTLLTHAPSRSIAPVTRHVAEVPALPSLPRPAAVATLPQKPFICVTDGHAYIDPLACPCAVRMGREKRIAIWTELEAWGTAVKRRHPDLFPVN